MWKFYISLTSHVCLGLFTLKITLPLVISAGFSMTIEESIYGIVYDDP